MVPLKNKAHLTENVDIKIMQVHTPDLTAALAPSKSHLIALPYWS